MSTSTAARPRTSGEARARRPLALIAVLGGLLAAAGPILVLLAVGVVGWFLADSGAHGTPTDGMRVGALAWLVAHGSGLVVGEVPVTVLPLGITLACAWTVWRTGLRVGHGVAGHGPDADRIGDGERDWTVLRAGIGFGAGYVAVAVATLSLADAGAIGASTVRVLVWALALTVLLAAPAIAVGSGRAAIWAPLLPVPLRLAAWTAFRVLRAYLLASLAVFALTLVLHLDDAATVLSRLHTSAGEATSYAALSAVLVPNAALLAGAFVLGPGFLLGTGNVVTVAGTSLGPLPLFPLVAAVPAPGAPPAWFPALLAVPVLVAAWASYRLLRTIVPLRWDHLLLAATGGGLLAGVGLAAATALAGGAVGPGRMQHVGAPTSQVLVHGLAALGVGALLGALALWVRRRDLFLPVRPDGAAGQEPDGRTPPAPEAPRA